MLIVLAAAAVALLAACVLYVASRFRRFSFMKRLGEKNRALMYFLSIIAALVIPGVFRIVNIYACVVVLLHLAVFFLLGQLVCFIVRAAAKKRPSQNIAGAAVLIVTALWLGLGWFFAHHIYETRYELETGKSVGTLRAAVISDSHLGITIDGEGFGKLMRRIEAEKPDVIFITGDFVDDDTSSEDMYAACRALGETETKYGIYFIFGNHDGGYFNYRSFSGAELVSALTENGVTVLEDETAMIDGRFAVVGRRDRSSRERAAAEELTRGIDSGFYVIMLDHQPNDYDAEAESGADLVLSGHTHGGHMIPAGWIGMAMGANDRVYGTETRGATTFIVTSGISGWAIPFKTGTHSEIVVIDVAGS